jgi:hypothetical protein
MHERLTVVALADQKLGDVRFYLCACISRGEVLQLLAKRVQFLNFRPQTA